MRFLVFVFFLVGIPYLARPQQFTSVEDSVGILHSYGLGIGGGVSFCDFDGDGWDDITLSTYAGDSIHFYRNLGGTFQQLSSLVPHLDDSKQVLWVDYDNDGDKDLYVATHAGVNRLFNNDGTLQFTDVTVASGLSTSMEDTYGAAWGDINNDGWLDLYVNNWNDVNQTNHLYLSAGNGTFLDITVPSGTADSNRLSFCNAFFDIDKDGFQDIYIANDKTDRNSMYKNMGNNTFMDISSSSNTDVRIDAMSTAIGDYDNNGYPDIYVTNSPAGNKLFRNDANSTFTEVAAASGVAFYDVGWGANFFDFDNDGDLDLYVCSGNIGAGFTQNTLYENLDYRSFSNRPRFTGDTVESYSNAIGDYNNDGFPDIIVSNLASSQSMLWKNGGNTNNWIKIELEGRISNRDGIGSEIKIYSRGIEATRYTHCGIGFLAQNSTSEIVGLDTNMTVDSLMIKWPSGHIDTYFDLNANQKYNFIEGATLPINPVLAYDTALVCEGDSVLMDVTGVFTAYNWSTGSTNQQTFVKPPGSFYVTVTNSFGFSGNSDTIHIAAIPNNLVLQCYAVPIPASELGNAIVEVSDGLPPYTYRWNDPLGQTNDTAFSLAPGPYEVLVRDQNDCFKTANTIVSNVTGQHAISNSEQPTIYPQPANDRLIVLVPENWNKSQLRIFNMIGEQVYERFVSGEDGPIVQIPVSTFYPGTYLLTFDNTKDRNHYKVIIQH